MRTIELERDLGHGWTATEARLVRLLSSIAVVSLVNCESSADVRLDLGKRIFLDAVPDSIPNGASTMIAGMLNDHLREDRFRALLSS